MATPEQVPLPEHGLYLSGDEDEEEEELTSGRVATSADEQGQSGDLRSIPKKNSARRESVADKLICMWATALSELDDQGELTKLHSFISTQQQQQHIFQRPVQAQSLADASSMRKVPSALLRSTSTNEMLAEQSVLNLSRLTDLKDEQRAASASASGKDDHPPFTGMGKESSHGQRKLTLWERVNEATGRGDSYRTNPSTQSQDTHPAKHPLMIMSSEGYFAEDDDEDFYRQAQDRQETASLADKLIAMWETALAKIDDQGELTKLHSFMLCGSMTSMPGRVPSVLLRSPSIQERMEEDRLAQVQEAGSQKDPLLSSQASRTERPGSQALAIEALTEDLDPRKEAIKACCEATMLLDVGSEQQESSSTYIGCAEGGGVGSRAGALVQPLQTEPVFSEEPTGLPPAQLETKRLVVDEEQVTGECQEPQRSSMSFAELQARAAAASPPGSFSAELRLKPTHSGELREEREKSRQLLRQVSSLLLLFPRGRGADREDADWQESGIVELVDAEGSETEGSRADLHGSPLSEEQSTVVSRLRSQVQQLLRESAAVVGEKAEVIRDKQELVARNQSLQQEIQRLRDANDVLESRNIALEQRASDLMKVSEQAPKSKPETCSIENLKSQLYETEAKLESCKALLVAQYAHPSPQSSRLHFQKAIQKDAAHGTSEAEFPPLGPFGVGAATVTGFAASHRDHVQTAPLNGVSYLGELYEVKAKLQNSLDRCRRLRIKLRTGLTQLAADRRRSQVSAAASGRSRSESKPAL